MLYEAFGKLHVIFDEQQVTEKFRKREFVVEIEDGNYPQLVKFQFTQDKCSALNSFQKGDKIKVVFGLSGREGKTRDGSTVYFTNLGAWKVEKIDGSSSGTPSRSSSSQSSAPNDAPPPDDDDIPF